MNSDKKPKELILKTCRACNKVKPISDFYARKRNKDGFDTKCASCHRRAYNSRYKRTKKTLKGHRKKRKKRNEKLRWEYLSTHPCVDCGEDDPIVLVFDHVSHRPKRASVSDLVHGAASVKTIINEIEKCEVRCANCHTRRHHMERMMLKGVIWHDGPPWKDD